MIVFFYSHGVVLLIFAICASAIYFFPSGKWILLLPTDEVEADSQVEVYFLLKSNIFLIKFVFFLDWYQRLVYLSNLTVFSMNSTGSDCYPLSPDVNYWISTTLTGSIVLFLVFHTIPSVTWYVIIDQRGSVSLCVIQPVAQFKLKLKVSTVCCHRWVSIEMKNAAVRCDNIS